MFPQGIFKIRSLDTAKNQSETRSSEEQVNKKPHTQIPAKCGVRNLPKRQSVVLIPLLIRQRKSKPIYSVMIFQRERGNRTDASLLYQNTEE